MKKFWKKTEGFTLVELVVVIAILGIMAGVGTVGYAGYVKKADQAADEQLLRNINQAFAAACIENGEDINSVDQAKLEISTTDKTVKTDTLFPGEYQDAFINYFRGNENTAFRLINKIVFNPYRHLFVAPELAGYIAKAYGNGTIYLAPEDIGLFQGSTYFGTIGISPLLEQVNIVAKVAADLTNGEYNTFNAILTSNEFRASAAAALGMDPNTTTDSDLYKKLVYMAVEKVESDVNPEDILSGVVNPIPDNIQTAINKIQANAAVLFTAQESAKMDLNDALAFLNSDNMKKQIVDSNKAGDPGKALSQSALAMGLFTSYAHYTGNTDLKNMIADPEQLDPTDVLAKLNPDTPVVEDPNDDVITFKEYLNSEQGQKDLEGYMASLRMVESSTGDKNAVITLLMKDFNDADLKDVLNSAVTQSQG